MVKLPLADLRRQAEKLASERDYDWLVVLFRIGQLEAILTWLDTCEATITPDRVRVA